MPQVYSESQYLQSRQLQTLEHMTKLTARQLEVLLSIVDLLTKLHIQAESTDPPSLKSTYHRQGLEPPLTPGKITLSHTPENEFLMTRAMAKELVSIAQSPLFSRQMERLPGHLAEEWQELIRFALAVDDSKDSSLRGQRSVTSQDVE